jgi:transcriptional regulator with XRE-family HTH domain
MLKAHMSDELTEETLGRRIRLARTESSLTQQQLAMAIGSDQSTVSRLESGKDVSSLLLTRIARATGKELNFFLRSEVTAPPDYFRLRKGDASAPGMVSALEDISTLIEDYERLERLPRL